MFALPTPKSTHQATTFDRKSRNKTAYVPRGARVTVAEAEGCGYVARLWMTFPGWFWQHWAPDRPVSQSILKTLIVRIYFDGAAEPQVAAPAGDLFGIGLCEVANFTTRYLGMSSGGFYLAFPMPFRTGFRVEVENLDAEIDTDVFMNVLYQRTDPHELPTFHAQFRTGTNPGPLPIPIAEAEGKGRYVGCALSGQSDERNYLSYLEAPEHVYVDDDWEAPRIVGTGLEDYFLGGWYFREGTFAGPNHAVPVKDAFGGSVAMIRTHDLDAIHFDRRLRFAFETPWAPERLRPFRWSAVGFLYLDRPCPAPPIPVRDELLLWKRVRDIDHASIP